MFNERIFSCLSYIINCSLSILYLNASDSYVLCLGIIILHVFLTKEFFHVYFFMFSYIINCSLSILYLNASDSYVLCLSIIILHV